MVYSNKFIAVIKVDGKILREHHDTVLVPFGSDYEIHFKNNHSQRAVVNVSVDGRDALDGSRMVVDSLSSSSLEGFLKGDDVSHRFRFIEKTQEISDYRGDTIDDGTIVISWQYETPPINYNIPKISYRDRSFDRNITFGSSVGAPDVYSSNAQSYANTDGITVNGGESNQSFSNTTTRALESTIHSMVIRLKGDIGGHKIEKPILVKTKVTCPTCGRSNSSKMKFCGNCGTSLVE